MRTKPKTNCFRIGKFPILFCFPWPKLFCPQLVTKWIPLGYLPDKPMEQKSHYTKCGAAIDQMNGPCCRSGNIFCPTKNSACFG
ncbi:hypothetical protein BN77_p2190011 [Rhizobium mesoamericanum STM3625]|uniref:Uncharacterized protein n=1 Tax=Rhizobium mesoamericanum STM3625 TaxID=1211777 RepID=K0Q6N9_9HYPH|nr:hypothetical protein BN77_p2190011 [Rhizobium mesoamericanum STM3625]